MHRFISILALISALSCFIVACGILSKNGTDQLYRNPSLQIMVDPKIQIPKSGSFIWGPHYYKVREDMKIDLAEVDDRLRSAIKNELLRRGYDEVEENSDLIVGFAAGLDTELDEKSLNEAYGDELSFSFPTEKPGENRIYHKGSLVIDVLDAKTRKLLWRGTILADINMNVTKQEKDQRVKHAVQVLLDHFPQPRTLK